MKKSLEILIFIVLFTSCKPDQERKVRASIWFFSSDREEIYRDLNNGTQEYLTCDQREIEQFMAMPKRDFKEFVNVCIDYYEQAQRCATSNGGN